MNDRVFALNTIGSIYEHRIGVPVVANNMVANQIARDVYTFTLRFA